MTPPTRSNSVKNNTCCCMAKLVILHTSGKDTMIFQGPSLNQFGQKPLYRAKKPSFFHVYGKKKKATTHLCNSFFVKNLDSTSANKAESCNLNLNLLSVRTKIYILLDVNLQLTFDSL